MTLAAGARLGPYEILSPLGSGGMGDVYRARDARLQRDVAIKVLRPATAEPASRRARFAREALVISRLNHPNICAVYDVGEHDDLAFLVMELIDGRSLDRHLLRGPLSIDTALTYGIQIASALDAAHRADVVHRDLKPANVMVTAQGIKLLDFGVAKLLDDPEANAAGSADQALTAEHRVVGTLSYMAPEQLEGRRVDARADLFSLGAMLYEMMTGRPAFPGGSPASITAAILGIEPVPVSAARRGRSGVPRGIDHVIHRALAKDPENRWQTARDIMHELQAIAKGGRSGWAPFFRFGARVVGVGFLALSLFWAAWLLLRPGARPQTPVEVFDIAAPPGTRLDAGNNLLAVAPDGRAIAFLAGPERSKSLIYVRRLDSPVSRPLAGTDGAKAPFWSPDSQSIGFYADGSHRIKRVAVSGGPVQTVAEIPLSPTLGLTPAAFWTRDGAIVFSQPDGLSRVDASGGNPRIIVPAPGPTGENARTMPSPVGKGALLYLTTHTWEQRGLEIVDFAGRHLGELPDIRSNAIAVGDFLLFRKGESLVAQPFNGRSMRLSGQPIVLTEGVQYNPANARTVFSATDDVLAYRLDLPRKLTWRDRSGRFLGTIDEGERDWNPVVAPDNSGNVALDRFDRLDGRFAIWIIDSQGRPRPLTHETKGRFPIWSPDGRWIAYWTPGSSGVELHKAAADGRGEDEVLLRADRAMATDWSADGRYLIYQAGTSESLWALPLTVAEPAFQVTSTPASMGRVSPDGRWIVYATATQGQEEIWAQAFPQATSRVRISSEGGLQPAWSATGREIFYLQRDGTLMSVSVAMGASLSVKPAVMLFKIDPGAVSQLIRVYSAAPDGMRFLVSEPAPADDRITVVLHWQSLVHR